MTYTGGNFHCSTLHGCAFAFAFSTMFIHTNEQVVKVHVRMYMYIGITVGTGSPGHICRSSTLLMYMLQNLLQKLMKETSRQGYLVDMNTMIKREVGLMPMEMEETVLSSMRDMG